MNTLDNSNDTVVLGQRGVSGCGGLMGKWRERRRWEDPAADKIAAARAMIQEADQRLHGIVTFLERTGMDRDDELVRRLRTGRGGSVIGPRRGLGGGDELAPTAAAPSFRAERLDVSGYRYH